MRELGLQKPDMGVRCASLRRERTIEVFSKALEGLFIDRMEQNEEITAKFMNEDQFREAVRQYRLKEVYRKSGGRPKMQTDREEGRCHGLLW